MMLTRPPSCMDLLDHEDLLFAMLEFLDETSRQNVLFVNRCVLERLTRPEAFHWRLMRLEREHGVYFGHSSIRNMDVRRLFLHQFRFRFLWQQPNKRGGITRHRDSPFSTQIILRFQPSKQCPIPSIWSLDKDNHRVSIMDPRAGLREFSFDTVLSSNASQSETYRQVGHPAVRDLLCGCNATVVVYGWSGAGKTHTMMGTPNQPGLLPRACQELFQAIPQPRSKRPIQSRIAISYIEIFGNEVTDLLAPAQKFPQNYDNMPHLVTHDVQTLDQVMTLIHQGEHRKQLAATPLNQRASRAHSLFLLHLTQTCGKITRTSCLILGDLGGARPLPKSDTLDWKATHINLGLLALKNCVDALNRRASYIPHAGSKLTMLLAAGLLPTNSGIRIVVCASQDPQHATETTASFQFAQACSGIQYHRSVIV